MPYDISVAADEKYMSNLYCVASLKTYNLIYIFTRTKVHNVESLILLENGSHSVQAAVNSTLNAWLNNRNTKSSDEKNITIHYSYSKKIVPDVHD